MGRIGRLENFQANPSDDNTVESIPSVKRFDSRFPISIRVRPRGGGGFAIGCCEQNIRAERGGVGGEVGIGVERL